MRRTLLAGLFVLGCDTRPAPVGQPETFTVADVVFSGAQLAFCDEFTRTAEDWARRLPGIRAGLKQNEKLKERGTCAELTGSRAEQARCTSSGAVRFLYAVELVDRNDAELKRCLDNGGHWTVNDSPEAHLERAKQLTAAALTPRLPAD